MNDKKKLVVMILLGVVVLGVGAFQFTQMSSAPAPAPKTEAKANDKGDGKAVEGEQPDPMKQLYALGQKRDPFQAGALPPLDTTGTTPPTQQDPPAQSKPPRTALRPRPGDPGGFQLPPVNPIPGNLNIQPTNGGATGPSMTLPTPGPSYNVTGVITGERPAAVFVDASGNQRLVTVGSSLDGDSQLVGVEKGNVTLRNKKTGKTQTLTVGGTPNVK